MDPITPAQIELTQSMDRTLKQMLETMNSVNASTGAQTAAFNDMTAAARAAAPELKPVEEALGALGEAQKKIDSGFKSFSDGLEGVIGKKTWDKFASSGKEALDLLSINVDSLTDAIANPFAAALGFAGGLWDTLVVKAAELARQGVNFALAMEEVRDKFGDLTQNTSRQVISVGKNMSASLREAAGGTGAFASKFGVGIDGAIARMQKASEIAGDLGATFDALGTQFTEASDELYVLKDGLAFTSEGLQATARLAMMGGQSLKSFSQNIMASVDKIGKHFGMSTKVLGGDVGKALGNFKMLGKMTGDYVKEITKAAVFTRKLGIEITTLTGLVDKFDDFESGAEAAAQLAQGFGLVIDPLKMMSMEAGPRLAELQKGFVATGRSIESMSRQERALLASTSGLSDEQVQLAFSQKGLSMSYDDISKGADDAAKKQASTQEVMNDLALNIKNILQDMESFTGFITAFFSGFGRGFGTSSGIRNILSILAHQLTQVFHIGVSVGNMFSKVLFSGSSLTGAKGMTDAIEKIGAMFVNISKDIQDFVGILNGDDVAGGAESLFTNIFNHIKEAFGGAAGSFDVMGMAKRFGIFILQMLQGATSWLVKSGIPSWIADLKASFTKPITEGGVDGFGDALKGIGANLEQLFPLVIELGTEFLSMIPRFFAQYPIINTIAAMFVAGGPILTFITSFGGEFFKTLWSNFGLMASTGATTGAADASQAAAAADVTAGVATTMESAVGEAATGGAGIFESLFKIIEDPAKLAAWGAGIGIFMMALAGAIRDVMLSFTEPLPGKFGKSFIDVVAESANKLSAIKAGDLIALGGILAGVFGGIGLFISALASAWANLPIGTMLIAAGIGMAVAPSLMATGAVLGIVGAISAPAIVSGIASGITSMLSSVIDAFTAAEFLSTIQKAGTLGATLAGSVAGITQFANATSAIANVVTGVKTALDAIYAVAPDLDSAWTSSRLIAKQELKEKLDTIKDVIELIIPPIADTFSMVSTTFAKVVDGKSTATKIATGAANLNSLVNAMGSISSVTVSIGTITTTLNTALADAGSWGFKGSPQDLIDNIKTVLDIISGTPENPGGIVKLLQDIPSFDSAAVQTKVEGIKSVSGMLSSVAAAISSIAAVKIADITAFGTSLDALMTEDGPLKKISTLFGTTGITLQSLVGIPTAGITLGADSVFDVLDHYIARATTTSTSMADERLQQFSTRVLKITDYMTTTRQILENLDVIPLDATIDRLGTDMKVAKSVFSVAGGAVKIAVQMNVTMNAEKISAGMIAGGYVVPTTEFGNYMQANDGVGEYFDNPDKTYDTRGSHGGPNSVWSPRTK